MSVEQAKARFTRVKFAEFLGADVVEAAHARAVLSVPLQQKLMNVGGRLSGGASASLLNLAGTLAAWTGIDLAAEPYLGCVDMSVRYLAAAADEPIVADAHIEQRSEELFFSAVRVSSAATGQLVAIGQVSYRLLEPR
jgi:acyl-coenzyme A thioesterase 13